MCRNIKPLFNYEPPVTATEIEAAALQFVRKISGFTKPSSVNEAAFNEAVREITRVSEVLLNSLRTHAEPKNREVEQARAKARNIKRFGTTAQAQQVVEKL